MLPVLMPRYCTTFVLSLPAALAVLLVLPSASAAQATNHQLIVTVTDDDGAPVDGLDVDDFDVREDDVRREVLEVGPAGMDRQVALLVDTSAAATGATANLRRALTAFVDGMHGDNEITLVTFGGPPYILVGSTREAAPLHEGIGRVYPLGNQPAYLVDTMLAIAEGFAQRRTPRPLMVVVTGRGIDYSSRNASEVLDAVALAGAAVYTISLPNQRSFAFDRTLFSTDLTQRRLQRDMALEQSPAASGGRHRELLASSALPRAMDDLIAELRNQYLVTYARPPILIPPEEVSVEATRPGLTARGTRLPDYEARR